jgi:hypothetical protein
MGCQRLRQVGCRRHVDLAGDLDDESLSELEDVQFESGLSQGEAGI